VRCVRCKGENPAEARFCLHCGATIGGACAGCGAALPEGSKFCPQCGRAALDASTPASYTPKHLSEEILAVRSSIEGERKQVTVVFCDIVRSSALAAEAGPEAFHRIIDRFFSVALDEVHRYEGTVNQFLGDGFMALFGAPIAHEDHARRAALAALGIKERAEVEIRIGINSGSVVVGAIGDDLRMDYTAFGDTTILAARLQAAAEPGGVLVSAATAEALRGYFELEGSTPVDVKERTVHALRITGRGPRTSPIDDADHQLSPFSGRAVELETLLQAFQSTAEGEGQVVGLAGDPGLGKSRLVYELRRATETEARAFEGRCLPFGSAVPYLPILDLVRDACGIVAGDDLGAVAAKIARRLEALGVDPDHGRYLHHALDVASGDEQLATLDPATRLRRTFDALRTLLVAEAAQPLLVLVEDMHWIDKTSEEFLTELVDELPAVPVLLLTTYRPGYNPPWIGKSYATQIALRPLSKEASERVVAWNLGEGDGHATGEIVERGEGNPFFLEELAQAARQQVAEGSGGPVPGTVQDVLAARIDRLDAGEKSAVQVAAVLGREFTLDLIEQVWDGDVSLLPALDELKRREFLQERHGAGERTFTFKHALTRDVAYEGLLEERRQVLHASAGAAVERAFEGRLHEKYELLAYHYSRSADRERAADYLQHANRKAAARHAMEEALDYFYAALEILEDLPDSEENKRRRLELVLDQTFEFHWLHRHEEFTELLLRHEPLALALGDRGLLGRFYSRLSHRQLVFGEYETSLETARKALELCKQGENAEDAVLAYTLFHWAHMMLGDYESALSSYEQTKRQLSESFHPIWFMYSQAAAAITHLMTGRWDEGLREIDRAAAVGAERSDNGMVSFGTAFGSWVSLEKRDWASAFEQANAAKEIAPTIYFRGFAFGFLASALCHAGAADQGLPILEQIAPMIRASRHELAWIFVAWRLADAYVVAGDLAKAKELLDEIHESATKSKVSFFIGGSERCLADIALAEGDASTALRLLEPAIETLRSSGSENEFALALAAYGRAQTLNGDDEEAHTSLEEARSIFERLGTLEEPERLRQELAGAKV
jgi:class 3 adenylate cyclase/tetratricopeptide (TPR) repeat protein